MKQAAKDPAQSCFFLLAVLYVVRVTCALFSRSCVALVPEFYN
jgi:hypothetical protein